MNSTPIAMQTKSSAPQMTAPTRYGLALLALMALSGMSCTSGPQARTDLACENFDWYEAGRTDGSSGLPASTFNERRASCRGKSELSELLYQNGREAGLVLYCTPTMAFEMGKASQAYDHVCPEHLEGKFLSAYEIGKRVRSLEGENIDLEARIETILRLLPSSHPTGNVNLRSQLENLKTRRASNESEISNLEIGIDSTQR